MNNKSINKIGQESHEVNALNGWDVLTPAHWSPGDKEKERFLCTHMALIHTEVSEATEAIRHSDPSNFQEELADTIIRITSIAYGLGIDIDSVIAAKLAKNRTRGFRHGGKAL